MSTHEAAGWGAPGRHIVPEMTHRCSAMEEAERMRSRLEAADEDTDCGVPETLYGRAITRIDRSRGIWWAHNDEYSNPVAYCPFCGERLPRQTIPDGIAIGDAAPCEICGSHGMWVILHPALAEQSPRGARCPEHEPPDG